jgi:hypothetical protein
VAGRRDEGKAYRSTPGYELLLGFEAVDDELGAIRRASGANSLSYWTYSTAKGVFSIVERTSRGVDLYFGQTLVAQYRSPVDAAEQLAQGNHPVLPCAPEDGKSLGVPSAVHQWTFVKG